MPPASQGLRAFIGYSGVRVCKSLKPVGPNIYIYIILYIFGHWYSVVILRWVFDGFCHLGLDTSLCVLFRCKNNPGCLPNFDPNSHLQQIRLVFLPSFAIVLLRSRDHILIQLQVWLETCAKASAFGPLVISSEQQHGTDMHRCMSTECNWLAKCEHAPSGSLCCNGKVTHLTSFDANSMM